MIRHRVFYNSFGAEIHKRLGAIRKRLGAIHKGLGAIYKRLGAIYKKIGAIYKKLGAKIAEIVYPRYILYPIDYRL